MLACVCMGRDKFAQKFYFCLKHNTNLVPAEVLYEDYPNSQ